MAFWVKFRVVNTLQTLFSKGNRSTGGESREVYAYLDASGKLNFELWDESTNGVIGIAYNTALVAGVWYHVVFTYAAGTDNTSCKIYLNGATIGDTSLDSGAFTSVDDTGNLPRIGAQLDTGGTRAAFFDGQMAMGPLGPPFCQVALTAAQVKNLYFCGADALGL